MSQKFYWNEFILIFRGTGLLCIRTRILALPTARPALQRYLT